jgi:hypothetical protein
MVVLLGSKYYPEIQKLFVGPRGCQISVIRRNILKLEIDA